MKFLRLSFRCFGPFEEQTLDLAGPGGLHVIYGPNEAGKSTALRGLHAFLFGFPGQSPDDFRFKYGQFRVHAILENTAGRQLECIRRKGIKDTLRLPNDKEAVADRHLADFLGGIDAAQFEQLFGLDASRLVAGGKTITDGQGELGEALFAAGAGMKGLRTLSQDLEKRQQALFLPSGKNQPIAKALRAHRDLRDQVRSLGLPADTYAAAEAVVQEAAESVKQLRTARRDSRGRLDELKRYHAALPTIDLLRAAQKRLAPVADAPHLSPDFDAKLEDVRNRLGIFRSKRDDQLAKQKDLARQLKEEQPPAAILAEEQEIDALKGLVAATAQRTKESIEADTFSRDEKGKARDIYRELTGTTEWERMDALKPRLDERQRITDLANAHAAVMENVRRQDEAVRKAKGLLADAERKLADAPARVDPSSWQIVVDQAMAVRPLEEQLRDRLIERQTEERRLAAEFMRSNPAVPGCWLESPALPTPLGETVERFRRELEEGGRACAAVDDAIAENDRETAAVETLRTDKVGAEPVPTVADLTAARRDRDGGLHCIRRRLDGQADELAERDFNARHAPQRPLMDAAEIAVRRCDTLADRLRNEADRVAACLTLGEKLHRLQEQRARLDAEACTAAAALAEIDQRWQAAWRASGVTPGAPEIMQAWLNRWVKFRDRVIAWHDDGQRCQEDEKRIQSLRDQLARACPAAQAATTLRDGLALAKSAIGQATAARMAAEKCTDEKTRLQSAVSAAEQEAERATNRSEEWVRQWAKAVAVLQLNDASPSIATAQDYLTRIDRMQQHLRDMRIKDARIREIERDRAHVVDRVNSLRQRLNPASRATTAATLDADFRDVEAALRNARELRTRSAQLAENLRKVEADLGKTTEQIRAADAALATLAAEAGAEADAIPEVVQRARERAQVAPQVRQCEDALAQNAHGLAVEDFIRAADGGRDGLDQKIDDLARTAEQLDTQVSDAEATALNAQRVLTAFRQASDAAAQARQQAALLACRLEDDVVEYAALNLARAVLEKAKQRYRARHQDTLLDKASTFFRTLTGGAFTGIEIDNDQDDDVLKAVRAAADRPDTLVAVDGLSDGTRDQLFLALRLAGIERHLKDREPVPLIVDDVLVNFDDDRTRATLRCLADLAQKTQVLLFTHHDHVVRLARTADPTAIVHNLGPCR